MIIKFDVCHFIANFSSFSGLGAEVMVAGGAETST